jgi:hypothetical protein
MKLVIFLPSLYGVGGFKISQNISNLSRGKAASNTPISASPAKPSSHTPTGPSRSRNTDGI